MHSSIPRILLHTASFIVLLIEAGITFARIAHNDSVVYAINAVDFSNIIDATALAEGHIAVAPAINALALK